MQVSLSLSHHGLVLNILAKVLKSRASSAKAETVSSNRAHRSNMNRVRTQVGSILIRDVFVKAQQHGVRKHPPLWELIRLF